MNESLIARTNRFITDYGELPYITKPEAVTIRQNIKAAQDRIRKIDVKNNFAKIDREKQVYETILEHPAVSIPELAVLLNITQQAIMPYITVMMNRGILTSAKRQTTNHRTNEYTVCLNLDYKPKINKSCEQIYNAIKDNPGSTAREIQELSKTSWTSVYTWVTFMIENGYVRREIGKRTHKCKILFANKDLTVSP